MPDPVEPVNEAELIFQDATARIFRRAFAKASYRDQLLNNPKWCYATDEAKLRISDSDAERIKKIDRHAFFIMQRNIVGVVPDAMMEQVREDMAQTLCATSGLTKWQRKVNYPPQEEW